MVQDKVELEKIYFRPPMPHSFHFNKIVLNVLLLLYLNVEILNNIHFKATLNLKSYSLTYPNKI